MELNKVIVTLFAETKQYIEKMDQAGAKMTAFGAKADATNARLTSMANKASTAIVGAGIAAAAVSVKMAANFQAALTTLVTGAGESEKNIEMVKKGILSMAGVVGQTPKALAEGMYLIESAGYHGAKGLTILKAAAEGAAVGNANMATVANAVTTALTDYNLPASKAAAVTSALVETVASGKTNLQDLATSIGKVMPVASALGINFQTVTGAMATMTNAGLSARFAAMHLQATLLSLQAPSKGSQKALDAVGLSSQQLKNIMADPKQGLGVAINTINEAVGKHFPRNSVAYVEAMKAIYGSTVAYSTALMLGGSHAKQFADNVDNIGKRVKATGKDVQGWALVQKDLNQQLKQLSGAGQALMINLGDFLLPKLTDIAKFGAAVIGWFKDHPVAGDILGFGTIGVFALALALKVKNAMKKVFDAGSDIWNGIKSVYARITGKGPLSNPLTGPQTAAQGTTMIDLLTNIDINTAKMAGGSAVNGLAGLGGAGGLGEAGGVAAGLGAGGAAVVAAGVAGLALAGYTLFKIASVPQAKNFYPVATGPRGIAPIAGSGRGGGAWPTTNTVVIKHKK
jgi:TP901 family phage tail tape measure protein